MKRKTKRLLPMILVFTIIAAAYSCRMLAMSDIGGDCISYIRAALYLLLFALWGAGTYGVLYLLLYTMYNKQKRRGLCHGLLLPAGVGMALTVCCPFDFERHNLWLLHCIGSLAFSVLSGVAIFLCFLFSFKKGRFWQCATVFWAALMIGDLILLLIYKETGLIEATPVLAGVVLLNIAIYQKEKVTAYAA